MTSPILPPDYRPTDDEPFMSDVMKEYFRQKLLAWRAELLQESTETLHNLQDGGIQEPDIADRASAETERSLELRTRDRERKLIAKIDEALEASRMIPTAIARKPASRSASAASKPVRSRP